MTWIENVLERLTPERFFLEYFEQKPIYLGQHGGATLFESGDLPCLVKSATEVCPDRLRANSNGIVLEPPRNALPVELQRWAFDAYDNGATLIINYVETLDLRCDRFARALGTALNAEVSLTVFATPAGAQGFTPHFDTLDVFVIQVHGSKNWCLGDCAVALPTLRQGRLLEIIGGALPVRERVELNRDGVLYIPRGVVHWAKTSAESSIHVTADICTVTRVDLLKASVAKFRHSYQALQEEPAARIAHLSDPPLSLWDQFSMPSGSQDWLQSVQREAMAAKWALKMSGRVVDYAKCKGEQI